MNDSLTAEIRAWLRAGAEVTAGLLLFSQFSNNTRFASLVKIKPAKYRPLLIEKLCTLAGITPPSEEARPARRRFRDDFPFLRAPDCPPELKILAADKITAHERYIQAHERLFDCTTLNECYRPGGHRELSGKPRDIPGTRLLSRTWCDTRQTSDFRVPAPTATTPRTEHRGAARRTTAPTVGNLAHQ